MRPLLRRIGNTSNTSASDIISPPTKIPIKSPAAASRISFPGNDGCSKKIRFPAVPPKITGFANGVASTAVEAAPEGEIFGKGVQIFTIAGPVILYGVFASWLFGLIYWLMHLI